MKSRMGKKQIFPPLQHGVDLTVVPQMPFGVALLKIEREMPEDICHSTVSKSQDTLKKSELA